jgi:NAD(P)H-dependent nitrite reductase small subunit
VVLDDRSAVADHVVMSVSGPWHPVIQVDRVPKHGSGAFTAVGNRELAVFALPDGGYVVIDNACPHAHGNLAGGTVEGTVVECPWHQWRFDLVTGRCTHNAEVCVRTYPTRVRDGVIEACLPEPLEGY